MQPKIVRLGQGPQQIAVMMPGRKELVLLDHLGNSYTRKIDFAAQLDHAYACDGNGDGRDELYFIGQANWCAVAQEKPERNLWTRQIGI